MSVPFEESAERAAHFDSAVGTSSCVSACSADDAAGARAWTLPSPASWTSSTAGEAVQSASSAESWGSSTAPAPVKSGSQGSFAPPPEMFGIRNLDTGEVRNLLAEPDESFFGAWSEPNKLQITPLPPWGSWWQEQRRMDERLWFAARSGNMLLLSSLLSESTMSLEETDLSCAAEGAARECGDSVTEGKVCRVNARSLHGRTALHLSSAAGHAGCVAQLLEARADPAARTDGGSTPLHIAAQHGHLDIAQQLVLAKGSLACQTTEGETPLHLAAARGHVEVVSFLSQSSDEVVFGMRNNYGQTAIDVCRDIDTQTALCGEGPRAAMRNSADTYAGRKTFCGVVLRNSRADVVRRLVQQKSGGAAKARLLESGCNSPPKSISRPWLSMPCTTNCCTDDADASFGVGLAGCCWLTASRRRRHQQMDLEPPALRRVTSRASCQAQVGQTGQSLRRRKSFCKLQKKDPSLEAVGPDSFQLLSVLGRGSFGEVFKVVHKRNGQLFAMKVLKKSKIMNRNLVRYTMTERNLLSYLRHPFIVRLHYAFQTPSVLVLVLQFCAGGSLAGLIAREGNLSEALGRLYLAEVFLAIEHLHERQVVYRDLKPENVVMDEGWHCLLTDFGLSKEGVEGFKGTRSFCGSVAYLAPEILARQGHGRSVDLYGLGVLLYEILSGHPPFYTRDWDQLFRNIASAPLQPPARASKSAALFITEMMHRNPMRRPGAQRTSDARAHPFFAELDFEKVLRREVPVPPLTRLHSQSSASCLSSMSSGRPSRATQPHGVGGRFAGGAAAAGKISSPFEGRLELHVRKSLSFSSTAQNLEGWEFAAADSPRRRAQSPSGPAIKTVISAPSLGLKAQHGPLEPPPKSPPTGGVAERSRKGSL